MTGRTSSRNDTSDPVEPKVMPTTVRAPGFVQATSGQQDRLGNIELTLASVTELSSTTSSAGGFNGELTWGGDHTAEQIDTGQSSSTKTQVLSGTTIAMITTPTANDDSVVVTKDTSIEAVFHTDTSPSSNARDPKMPDALTPSGASNSYVTRTVLDAVNVTGEQMMTSHELHIPGTSLMNSTNSNELPIPDSSQMYSTELITNTNQTPIPDSSQMYSTELITNTNQTPIPDSSQMYSTELITNTNESHIPDSSDSATAIPPTIPANNQTNPTGKMNQPVSHTIHSLSRDNRDDSTTQKMTHEPESTTEPSRTPDGGEQVTFFSGETTLFFESILTIVSTQRRTYVDRLTVLG